MDKTEAIFMTIIVIFFITFVIFKDFQESKLIIRPNTLEQLCEDTGGVNIPYHQDVKGTAYMGRCICPDGEVKIFTTIELINMDKPDYDWEGCKDVDI